MTFSHSEGKSSVSVFSGIARLVLALGLTGMLLVFLVVSRWQFSTPEVLTLRTMEGIDPVSAPSPPPPPPVSSSKPPPPPPPSSVELPKIDLAVNETAPAIKAALQPRELDITMKPAEFAVEFEAAKAASLFSQTDLDSQPRLLNRPQVSFPASQRRMNVKEGRVTLEVLINASGRVTVRRIVSSSHPDFVSMAKNFATRSRFSPPKKDGRPVNAIFNWPLVLRP